MSAAGYDIVVIGGGPAGMSAAIQARKSGLSVAVVDEQPRAGGQIYRGVDRLDLQASRILGQDYAKGAALVDAFKRSGAVHVSGASVWNVTREGTVSLLRDGSSETLAGRFLIVATGAVERPFPVPGWTRTGVMTAGAAQIMLKASKMVPFPGVVLAGCGPLLYLLAAQYVRAGVRIGAIVDTTARGDYRAVVSHFQGLLRGWRDIRKGIGMLLDLRKAGMPIYSGATELRIEGNESAEAVTFTYRGRSRRIETPLVLLHQGVVPNTQISWALRCDHMWNAVQSCWEPSTDPYGRIADSNVFIAGDGRRIVGAQASGVQGTLAALAAGAELGAVRDLESAAWPAAGFSDTRLS